MNPTLAELSEAELLKRLARFAPPDQLSDDTAALPIDRRPLLINTDVIVDGIHFSDSTTTPTDVGWRAVAANLSDLAASGAVEIEGITVALVAPGRTSWDWVDGVYQGISAALGQYGGILLGGDCSKGEQRLLSITALGRLGPLRLHRNAARPSDVLVTSGPHGLSRLGLALLQDDPSVRDIDLPSTLRDEAIARHKKPTPRLEEVQQLLACKPEHLPWRAGGTDSSDGLLFAVSGLCNSSCCGAMLRNDKLPVTEGWPKGSQWTDWCLAGGEDFELVLSLPEAWADVWQQCVPKSQRIGQINAEAGVIRWAHNHEQVDTGGFDHFGKP